MQELFAAMVAVDGVPSTDEDLLTLFTQITSPEHFVAGLMLIKHVPDYTVAHKTHCPA